MVEPLSEQEEQPFNFWEWLKWWIISSLPCPMPFRVHRSRKLQFTLAHGIAWGWESIYFLDICLASLDNCWQQHPQAQFRKLWAFLFNAFQWAILRASVCLEWCSLQIHSLCLDRFILMHNPIPPVGLRHTSMPTSGMLAQGRWQVDSQEAPDTWYNSNVAWVHTVWCDLCLIASFNALAFYNMLPAKDVAWGPSEGFKFKHCITDVTASECSVWRVESMKAPSKALFLCRLPISVSNLKEASPAGAFALAVEPPFLSCGNQAQRCESETHGFKGFWDWAWDCKGLQSFLVVTFLLLSLAYSESTQLGEIKQAAAYSPCCYYFAAWSTMSYIL